MMVSIFVLLLIIMAFALGGFRRTAIAFYFSTILFAIFVFWLHMSEALKINW